MFSIEFAAPAAVLLLVCALLFMTYRYIAARPRQPWMPVVVAFVGAGLGTFAIILVATGAIAQETVAQAAGETTKVTWAWGATLAAYASAVRDGAFALVAALLAFAARKLPAQVYAVIVSLRAEQFLQKAIEYGINSVADASKDKKLEFDVGNEVLAKALQYILDNAPGWLVSWLGGPDSIAKKLWARLDLQPAATDQKVDVIAAETAPQF